MTYYWEKQNDNWFTFNVGPHEKSHVIVKRILSVKPVLWLVVNLHHVLSDEAAFNTQRQLVAY